MWCILLHPTSVEYRVILASFGYVELHPLGDRMSQLFEFILCGAKSG